MPDCWNCLPRGGGVPGRRRAKKGTWNFFCTQVCVYSFLHSFVLAIVIECLLCAGKTQIKLCINPRGCKDQDSHVRKIIHNEHIYCESRWKRDSVRGKPIKLPAS